MIEEISVLLIIFSHFISQKSSRLTVDVLGVAQNKLFCIKYGLVTAKFTSHILSTSVQFSSSSPSQ